MHAGISHREALCRAPLTFAHTALFSFTSILTSFVFMCFCANCLISLIALGARFLKDVLFSRLCRWMVYSRVTTVFDWSFFAPICKRRWIYPVSPVRGIGAWNSILTLSLNPEDSCKGDGGASACCKSLATTGRAQQASTST